MELPRIELLPWLLPGLFGGLATGSVKTRVNAGLEPCLGVVSDIWKEPSDLRIISESLLLRTLARCTRSRRLVVSKGILFND